MPINLNLAEKCYLVALFGAIPESRRRPLFEVSRFPPQAGPEVMRAGYEFRDSLDGTSIVLRRRRRHRMAIA